MQSFYPLVFELDDINSFLQNTEHENLIHANGWLVAHSRERQTNPTRLLCASVSSDSDIRKTLDGSRTFSETAVTLSYVRILPSFPLTSP